MENRTPAPKPEIQRLPTRPVTRYTTRHTDRVIIAYGNIATGFNYIGFFDEDSVQDAIKKLGLDPNQITAIGVEEMYIETYEERYNPDFESEDAEQ